MNTYHTLKATLGYGLICLMLLVLTGCPSGENPPDPDPDPDPVDVVISVHPASKMLRPGEVVQMVAQSSKSGEAFDWTSSDPSIATVNQNGLVTAMSAYAKAPADTLIKAKGRTSGKTGKGKVSVVDVTISGPTTVGIGHTVQLNGASTESRDDIQWSTSNAGVASVDADGIVTGNALGTVSITATGSYSGFSATQDVAVQAVSVSGPSIVGVGNAVQLAASSSNSSDTFGWASANTAIATVSASGSVTGVAPGTVSISATGSPSGASGSHQVTVVQVTVNGGGVVGIGKSTQLSATSTDGQDQFQWTSANNAIATVNAQGNVTGVATGTVAITATGSHSGITGAKNVTVHKVTVTGPATLPKGDTKPFSATSTDTQDTFTWSSSNQAVAVVNASGNVTAVSIGAAMITATGTHSGATGSRQVTVIEASASIKLWDGEVSFTGENGVWNHTDAFQGSGCFEGIPTQYKAPVLRLSGLPSWRMDIANYDEIWLFAKCDQSGKTFSFQVGGYPLLSNSVNIDPYIDGGVLDSQYRLIRIPLADLRTAQYTLDKVESFYFGLGQSGQNYHIFVDEIWAVDVDSVDPDATPLMGALPSVTFADTIAGGSKNVIVPIANLGVAPLDVTSITIGGANSDSFAAVATPFTVAPGATHDLEVTFAPTNSGLKKALCTLEHTNTPLGGLSTFQLSGTCVAPTLSISGLTLDFGGVPIGQTALHQLTLTNSGNTDLIIGSISSTLGLFSTSLSSATLAPNESRELIVSFTPNAVGNFESAVSLVSNDPLRPNISVTCTGAGLPAGSLGELPVEVGLTTSSSVSLSWPTLAAVDNAMIYISPEPGNEPGAALAGQTLWDTIPASNSAYTLDELAASVDVFVRIELTSGGTTISAGNVHARTSGGPMAQLDTPLREVHAYAPNVLMLVLNDEWVQSYSGDTGSLIGYSGPDWQSGTWSLTRAGGGAIGVTNVYRHSIPVDHPSYTDLGNPNYANVEQAYGSDNSILSVDHRIFLVLSEAIGSRDVLTVQGPNEFSFVLPFSDRYLETPVIQVNQVGYSPLATERWAYVSGWMGDGGPLALGSFPSSASVLSEPQDHLSPRPDVVNGLSITLRAQADADAGTDVKQIDLSSLPEADGLVYRVRIPGVGVSWPTQVSNIAVYKAFYTVTRGMYYNRWGRDLQPAYTEWGPRPPDHPIVYTAERLEYGFGDQAFFPQDTPRTGARPLTGGHHDAGDWDIQYTHWLDSMLLLRAFELNPDAFTDGQLTVPESGNGIPDLLDEALYSLRGWEQLQESDGGVRVGVESYGHPPAFYYADVDTMPYWTYSCEPSHTARVAALFARASRLVEPFDSAKATELRNRAIAAYDFAVTNGINEESQGVLVFASSELFRLTGDPVYVQAFEATLDYWDKYGQYIPVYHQAPQLEPGYGLSMPIIGDFLVGYVLADGTDPAKWYKTAAVNKLKQMADDAVSDLQTLHAHRNGRAVTQSPSWGKGTTVGEYMMRVYAYLQIANLSPEQAQPYLNAISLSADYFLGCNPSGQVWVTGLGSRFPTNPLYIDALTFIAEGQGLLPGLAVFGPTLGLPGSSYYDYGEHVFYPDFLAQPLMRRYADIRTFVSNNEGGAGLNAQDTLMLGALLPEGITTPDTWLPWQPEHRNPLPPNGS